MTERWEQEVDRAVRGLVAEMDDDARARGRTTLMEAIRTDENRTSSGVAEVVVPLAHRHRSSGRWLAAAAAVVALSAAVVVVTDAVGGERRVPNPPAQVEQIETADQVLQRAASNVDTGGEVVPDGKYLYVKQRAWWSRYVSGAPKDPDAFFVYLDELRIESWVPADRTQTWRRESENTGERQWLVGTEQEARAAGLNLDVEPPSTQQARCGKFREDADGCGAGGWYRPTERWVAGLPEDPKGMLERLREDSGATKPRPKLKDPNANPDALALQTAAEGLHSGLLPAKVRSTVYQAIALMKDIEITEKVANLDGRKGTALGLDDGRNRFDVIVDYDTGEFIGEREVQLKDSEGIKAGTVKTYTSFVSTTVDEPGQRPEN